MPVISPPDPAEVVIAGAPPGATVISGSRVPAPDVLDTPISGPGESVEPFDYLMPMSATTALINHTLGHDPVAVQVFVDGQLCDEYGVTFTIPGQQVLIGFDVSVIALIRLF